MKIYVASSWRNIYQETVVHILREMKHEVYDFKEPMPGCHGFSWSEIDPAWKQWTPYKYREALSHPVAHAGYGRDFAAMRWADCFVGVLPYGCSASAEMGWAAGNGKKTLLFMPRPCEPELMFKMFDGICITVEELKEALQKFAI